MLNEVGYQEAEVQPLVQARGGEAGARAGCFQRAVCTGLGHQSEPVSQCS
jgi:hypothetical protein